MFPFLIICSVLALDFFSKFWVHRHLPLMVSYPFYPYGGVEVFKDWGGIEFSITHLTNAGAAWGALKEYQGPLVGVRIFLIAALILYALFGNTRKSWQIPLSLLIAGAVGNVMDYFLYGHVVDMFHFVFWGYAYPVFNVADSAVCLAIGWLILLTTFQKQADQATL